MLLYKDILTGDEMFSDSFPIKEIDNTVIEVDCAMITIGGENIDIGANASAEGGDEGVEDGQQQVNNVIHSFRLTDTQFDKKSFMPYFKDYLKALKAKLRDNGKTDEDIDAFEKRVAKYFKETILKNFKDYEFYIGESMTPEGMVALLNYREDGVTPYFTFWKDGLETMKL